jgi:hypothetical protein
MGYPKPYDTTENRKAVAELIQKFVSNNNIVSTHAFECITAIDKELYSEQFRNYLITIVKDSSVKNALLTEEMTRQSVYRYYLKGSNVVQLLMYYLKKRHELNDIPFPTMFDSDWDSSILINPGLNSEDFNTILESIIPVVLNLLSRTSLSISNAAGFKSSMEDYVKFLNLRIDDKHEFEEFRKYPIHFENKGLLKYFGDKASIDRTKYGNLPVGAGLRVSSDRTPGKKNVFYLARLMVNVVASRDIPIPVEIVDVSMNYQNASLQYAWDSYSEYHIQHGAFDYRIISPSSLYADLVKCLQDAMKSNNATRKLKIPSRIKRIYYILDSMLVPYGNRNTVMAENVGKHSIRTNFLGNVYRKIPKTLKYRPLRPTNFYESDEESMDL